MELEQFGAFLKRGREARGLSIAELSRATKIKEQSLELLEASRLEALPAAVFVRGFVCAYAREVGLDQTEALSLLKRALPAVDPPLPRLPVPPPPVDAPPPAGEGRRRVGVALVVLLILVVATLTLSLLLRHGRAGDGLSERGRDLRLVDHVEV